MKICRFLCLCVFVSLCLFSFLAQADDLVKSSGPVELNGDSVEYDVKENKFVASGNVSVVQGDVSLFCDQLTFYRGTQEAHAKGHVILEHPTGSIWAEQMEYNFQSDTGEFFDAEINAHPYFGRGKYIEKTSSHHIVMYEGYLTTSDYDDPGYHFATSPVDIFSGDKAVARNLKLKVGNVPIAYWPRYTQDLTDGRPKFSITPGYEKDWGAFVLTKYRKYWNEYLNTTLRLDYRELRDVAWGVDLEYNTHEYGYGDGVIKTYYMNERTVGANRLWKERTDPTTEQERYRVEWRHKWDIDDQTQFIAQYYKLSDSEFLKEYIEKQFREESNPTTYALFTKSYPYSTFSVRTDVRVNRFQSAVERLPEVKYDMINQQIGETGVYFKSENSVANLVEKSTSPSDVKDRTIRIHTDSEVSYPFKMSFIDAKPFAGAKFTYYDRASNSDKNESLRNVYRVGMDLSTKFYRVYDVYTDKFGLDVNRLRHIITPTISHKYEHAPSIENADLFQFDSVDSQVQSHKVSFGIENKLQTKRGGQVVDLVRFLSSTSYNLHNDPGSGSWQNLDFDLEVNPIDEIGLYADWQYSAQDEEFKKANFDLLLSHPNGRMALDIGSRYTKGENKIMLLGYEYKINPKWRLSTYGRFDVSGGETEERQIKLIRDLHSWEVELLFNNRRSEGSELMLVFRLKAFPDVGLDAGRSFNRPKRGSLGN